MEPSALYTVLQNLQKPQPLRNLREPLGDLTVIIHRPSGNKSVKVRGLAPFHTVEDIQRALWLQQEKPDDLYPKFCHLAYERDDEMIPALYTCLIVEDGDVVPVQIDEAMATVRARDYQPAFVDEDGNKLPVNPNPRGRASIDDVFLTPMGGVPTLHAYPLQGLLSAFPGPKPMSAKDWYGLFYPYFPDLAMNETGVMTPAETEIAAHLAEFMTAKLAQVAMLDSLRTAVNLREFTTTGVRFIGLQWAKREREEYFGGLDSLFFSADVNATRPFMRLISANNTPITKLFQPDPLEPPQVSDPVLLKSWADEPNPIACSSMLFVKTLIRRAEFGMKPLYGTLRVCEDTTAVFTIEPPKDQRILDFRKDLRNLETILTETTADMPFNVQAVRLGAASLRIEATFESAPPKGIQKIAADRISQLNTLFQPTEQFADEQKSFLSFRYKGVSNFFTADRVQSYLNYLYARKPMELERLGEDARQLAREFQISEDEAGRLIQSYLDKTGQVTPVDDEASDFLVLNNPGIDVSLSMASMNSLNINLFNIRAVSIDDIRRVCTVLGLIFYTSESQWQAALRDTNITKAATMRAAVASVVVEREEKEEEDAMDASEDEDDDDRSGVFVAMGAAESEDEDAPPPRGAPAPAAAAPAAPAREIGAAEQQRIVAQGWFNNRLKELDKTLFGYTGKKTGKKTQQYSTKCPPAVDRYPFALTEAQYQNMRRIYAQKEGEKKVAFIVYGVPNTKETIDKAVGSAEKITVLRYGSDPKNLFYFLCMRILCLKDLMPILEEDWNSRVDYNGEPKPKESCPFCHGLEIKDRHHAQEGHTVFIRKNAPRSTEAFTQIGFLGKPEHPNGYELPCCFGKLSHIPFDDRFKFIKDAAQPNRTAVEEAIENRAAKEAERSANMEESLRVREQLLVDYSVLRHKLAKEYVLGHVKYPLDPGKVGLPSLQIDAFFGQNSRETVNRVAIKQEFKPTARGFYRMGVNNKLSFLNQSLFSALGPMLGINTIKGVQDYFSNMITPRIFINLNFGNLVLEFFDPTDPEESDSVLASWAQKHLLVPNLQDTLFEISRYYRSYQRFQKYIYDPTQRKQMRHFAHALAEIHHDIKVEDGVTTHVGLTIMTLHYKGDPRDENTPIEVLCPLEGIDINRYANNVVGFMTYSDVGVWEPLFFLNELNTFGTARSDIRYVITQQDIQDPTFPEVARKRYVDEFIVRCRSAHRGAFTLQSGVDNRALVPLSKAIDVLQSKVTGFVRDVYNHVVAVTVTNPNKAKADEILVPVVDDGNSFHENTALKIHLGIKSVKLASANDVYQAYEQIITPRLYPLSNVYKISSFLNTNKIVGFRLGGADSYATVLLPCGPQSTEIPAELIEQADAIKTKRSGEYMFEYVLNNEIITIPNHESYGDSDASAFVLQKKQVDILYEHFRLAFSTWISGGETRHLRKFIEKTCGVKQWLPMDARPPLLPSYIKMYRLKVILEPYLQKWFEANDEPIDTKNIVLRNDCIAIDDDEAKCTGACTFVKDEDGDGQCKIHIPREVQVRSTPRPTAQPAAEYFINRLFDEIIRMPYKRNELMTKGVKRLQVPSTDIHIGAQWVIPQNVPAWYELLRQDSKSETEQPQFYEEFSRSEQSDEEQVGLEEERRLYPLPAALAALLPRNALDKLALEVIGSREKPRTVSLRRYFGIRQSKYVIEGATDMTTGVLAEISKKYKLPIVQVLLGQNPVAIIGITESTYYAVKTGAYVIIPDFEEGPAILVMRDDITDTVPAKLIEGRLLESIEPMRYIMVKRPKVARSAAPSAPPAENVRENSVEAVQPKPRKVKVVRQPPAAPAQPPPAPMENMEGVD